MALIFNIFATLLLVSASQAGTKFRSAYFDDGDPEKEIVQFYSGADDDSIYEWGYNFGERGHSERKDLDGEVHGRFYFVDANGVKQSTVYMAHPTAGFTLQSGERATQGDGAVYLAPEIGEPAVEFKNVAIQEAVPAAEPEPAQQPSPENNIVKFRVGPEGSPNTPSATLPLQLGAALRDGYLLPLGAGQRRYQVLGPLAEQSASALAAELGVGLVGAQRHDQQQDHNKMVTQYSALGDTSQGTLHLEEGPAGQMFIVTVNRS